MNSKIFRGVFYSLLCLLSVWCQPSSLHAKQIDNEYIPESAFGIVDVDIAKLKQQWVNEYFPSEVITAMGEEYYGFDLMAVKKIRVLVAEGETSLEDLQVGIIYELEQAVDIASNYQEQTPEFMIDGQPVYFSFYAGLQCVQPKDTTVLFASADLLKEMALANNVSTPLTQQMTETEMGDSEVLGLLAFEQIKDAYEELVSENPIPHPMGVLNSTHHFLKSAEFRMTDGEMNLRMVSYDEKQARKLKIAAKRLLGLAKTAILGGVAMMTDGEDPVARAVVAYTERIILLLDQDLSPKRDGVEVTMRLKSEAAVIGLVASWMTPMMAFNAPPAPIEIEDEADFDNDKEAPLAVDENGRPLEAPRRPGEVLEDDDALEDEE